MYIVFRGRYLIHQLPLQYLPIAGTLILTSDDNIDEMSVRFADDHHVNVADVYSTVFQGDVADLQVVALFPIHRRVTDIVLVIWGAPIQ